MQRRTYSLFQKSIVFSPISFPCSILSQPLAHFRGLTHPSVRSSVCPPPILSTSSPNCSYPALQVDALTLYTAARRAASM